MPKTKRKRGFTFHLSKGASRFLFRLSVVYLLILGVLNIGFIFLRPRLEGVLRDALEAEKVEIGYIANVPFIFASIESLKIQVNPELRVEFDRVYFRYRFWKIFTREWELFPASFSISKTEVDVHSFVLKEYINLLKNKYKWESSSNKKPTDFDPNKMIFDIKMRNTAVTLRSMAAYRVDLTMNNIQGSLHKNTLEWSAALNLQTKWSNQVGILVLDSRGSGIISNMGNPSGSFTVGVNQLNLGGLPFISPQKESDPLDLNFTLDQGYLSFNTVSQRPQRGKKINPAGVTLEGDQKQFKLVIDKPFDIKYREFEEYQMLDYAFQPGRYQMRLILENRPDWSASLSISSPDYPNHGASIGFYPLGGGSFRLPVDIRTHNFGAIRASLQMDDRKGLLPLPSGELSLSNVRFLLPGLVFSGNTIVKALPGKNNIDITAYDASMNGGRIGNTRVDLGVYDGSHLIIKPLPFSNDVEVNVDVDHRVNVHLKALNLDGHFLKENTKMAIFGLDTSTYRGDIYITKSGRNEEVLVDGAVTGYLDDEPQIEVQMKYTNDLIVVPRLYFIGQKLLIDGQVAIAGNHTNTRVDISANAQLGTNVMLSGNTNKVIPVNVSVIIEKDRVDVNGLIDNHVPFTAKGMGTDVDLDFAFKDYPLSKLMVQGTIGGDLSFKFSQDGWTAFSFKEGRWNLGERIIRVDFDSRGETNYLALNNFSIGVDNELITGLPGGYIDVRKGIGGAVRFNQGGGLQFIFGTYTAKALLDIRQFRIDEFFALPFMGPLRALQDASTETIYADLRTELNGTLTDPDLQGYFYLSGDSIERAEAVQNPKRRGKKAELERLENPAFQMTAASFSKKGKEMALSNFRLRHPSYNVDGDIHFTRREGGAFDAGITGAMAIFGNAVKSGMSVSIRKDPESGIMEYKIPNLYVFSKKPMSMTGKILQQGSRIVLLSDDPKFGVSGYYDANPKETLWNILFQTDAIRLNSEGRSSETYFSAFLEGQALLKKLNMNRPIRKMDGTAEIHLRAEGLTQNPVVNGNVLFKGLSISTDSLKNTLKMPADTEILIQNNRILIPDFPIVAGSANQFGLKGWISLQDRAIEEMDVELYSRQGQGGDPAALNWRLNIPLLSVSGQTAIDRLRISGAADNLAVESKILAKNMNLSLELGDLISGTAAPSSNPLAGILSILNFNIQLTLGTGARFLHQLFDFRFQPNQNIQIAGNLGDNTFTIDGGIPIQSGTINYLGKSLKIDQGQLAFSGDAGDPFPSVNVNTETTEKGSQGEQITVNVAFSGKLPNIELNSVSSTPPRSIDEIYGLLGFGGNIVTAQSSTNTLNSSQAVVASGVGIAENAFFIAPLTQRLRKAIGFFDSLQVKTDILGNLTRSLALGNNLTGLELFSGSEIEVGKNVPEINGLQLRYNLRFENPPNVTLENTGYLSQKHKLGLLFDYRTPSLWQLSLGLSGQFIIDPPANFQQSTASTTTTEIIVEGSIKRSFGWEQIIAPQKKQVSKPPVFE